MQRNWLSFFLNFILDFSQNASVNENSSWSQNGYGWCFCFPKCSWRICCYSIFFSNLSGEYGWYFCWVFFVFLWTLKNGIGKELYSLALWNLNVSLSKHIIIFKFRIPISSFFQLFLNKIRKLATSFKVNNPSWSMSVSKVFASSRFSNSLTQSPIIYLPKVCL